MIFSIKELIGIFFSLLVFNAFSYYFIRVVIDSIAWCDKGGKRNVFNKLKSQMKFSERVSMEYLKVYVKKHNKEFDFWMRIKKVFVIAELLMTVIYIICACIYLKSGISFLAYSVIAILLQAILIALIMFFQTNINRDTKYDIIRKSKKH